VLPVSDETRLSNSIPTLWNGILEYLDIFGITLLRRFFNVFCATRLIGSAISLYLPSSIAFLSIMVISLWEIFVIDFTAEDLFIIFFKANHLISRLPNFIGDGFSFVFLTK
jgi:hypothetical protein